MSEEKLFLKVLTRKGKILSDFAEAIFLPTITGEIGILPGHRPLLGILGIGVLKYLKDGKELFLGISKGIVEVFQNNVNLFLEEVIQYEEISEQEERLKIKELEEKLKNSAWEEQEKIKDEIKISQTKIFLLTKNSP